MRDFVLHSISKSEEANRMRDASRLYPDEEGSLDHYLLYKVPLPWLIDYVSAWQCRRRLECI